MDALLSEFAPELASKSGSLELRFQRADEGMPHLKTGARRFTAGAEGGVWDV